MRVSIEGHHFDTAQAAGHWEVLHQPRPWGEERGTFFTIVDVYCASQETGLTGPCRVAAQNPK